MATYLVDGNPVELDVDDEFIALRFDSVPKSIRAAAVDRLSGLADFRERIELEPFGLTLVPVVAGPARPAEIRRSSSVRETVPVYKRANTRLVPTGRVIVSFEPQVDEAQRAAILLAQGLTETEVDPFGDVLARPSAPATDVFELAAALSAIDEVEFAEPDFITIIPRPGRRVLPPLEVARRQLARLGADGAAPGVPSRGSGEDPLGREQYYLQMIEASKAWTEAGHTKSTVVAVLDEGVDTLHPDLDTIIGSYDGTDDDAFQEPKGHDAHGTACAGIIGATADNGLGVRGVAAGCRLLAIRIAYSDASGQAWITSNRWIERSIDWAWRNGADVLSNSWGGGAPSNKISRAFRAARSQGRNGLGAIVVVAAGNDDQPVDFPGNLPEILTVAASNQHDEPKTKHSADGEYWWGSNYGAEVDVAAPGVSIATTDITGDRGYNRTGSAMDYTLSFNGTSSACPQVAAVCALILSTNRGLREAEVRKLVCDTADKVGSVTYDAAGHHPRMGYGRLNALQAVLEAKRLL